MNNSYLVVLILYYTKKMFRNFYSKNNGVGCLA